MTRPHSQPSDRPPFDNGASTVAMAHQDRAQREEIARLRLGANSARALIERHRARHGTNHLLDTALRELDDVLPPVVNGEWETDAQTGTQEPQR